MSCLITSGISLGCRDANGGIQEVYIGAYNGSAMTYTLGTSSNENQITAFAGTTVSFYTIEQPQETASFTSPGEYSTENMSSFYTHTLDLTIYQLSASTNLTINTLGRGAWRIIVKDKQGNYFLLGYQNGMRVSSATPGLGKAMGDLNGATLTFTSKEPIMPYQITTAAALSVITG